MLNLPILIISYPPLAGISEGLRHGWKIHRRKAKGASSTSRAYREGQEQGGGGKMQKDTFHNIINQMHCLKYIVKQLEDLDLISPCFFERTWRSCGVVLLICMTLQSFSVSPIRCPNFASLWLKGKNLVKETFQRHVCGSTMLSWFLYHRYL